MLSNTKMKVPWRITFDTNPDQCNLNCIMCEEHSIYNKKKKLRNRVMDFKIIKKVVEETVDFGLKEIIPSTMGEPLLYRDFKKIINLIKMHNLKLNLTTNGTFPILGVNKWTSLILPIASDIKISINGFNTKIAQNIMRGLNFKKQVMNIKKLIEFRDKIRMEGTNNPSVTLQVTFMEQNVNDLKELLKFAIKLDVDRLKGHHLWITHNEIAKESLKRNKHSIERWNSLVDELNFICRKTKLKSGKHIILDNVYKLNNSITDQTVPSYYLCPFLGKEAWIDWNGNFNVCCAPDNLRRSFGNFGNVREANFNELWNAKKYNNLVNNWGDFSLCKECNMRKPVTKIIGVC
ncbi:MAG: radical SAM protein [Candidatus Lokiarchaeota archaeon]